MQNLLPAALRCDWEYDEEWYVTPLYLEQGRIGLGGGWCDWEYDEEWSVGDQSSPGTNQPTNQPTATLHPLQFTTTTPTPYAFTPLQFTTPSPNLPYPTLPYPRYAEQIAQDRLPHHPPPTTHTLGTPNDSHKTNSASRILAVVHTCG